MKLLLLREMQNIGNDPLFAEEKIKAHPLFQSRSKFWRYNMNMTNKSYYNMVKGKWEEI